MATQHEQDQVRRMTSSKKSEFDVWSIAKLLVGVFLLVFALSIFLPGTETIESPSTTYPRYTQFNVSAEMLSGDYNANEVAADLKYKGQRFSISGKVRSIEQDFSNEPVVVFDSGGTFSNVRAKLEPTESQKDIAAKLVKGQILTIDCTGYGEIFSMPFVKDCKL